LQIEYDVKKTNTNSCVLIWKLLSSKWLDSKPTFLTLNVRKQKKTFRISCIPFVRFLLWYFIVSIDCEEKYLLLLFSSHFSFCQNFHDFFHFSSVHFYLKLFFFRKIFHHQFCTHWRFEEQKSFWLKANCNLWIRRLSKKKNIMLL
jgi:hypothetical protein